MKDLQSIQNWYKLQCNGDWEHEYGIKIQTLDNPGWNISIDLTNTILQGFTIEKNVDNSDNDWFYFKSDGKVFSGSGDPNKLNILLEEFISFALQNIGKSNYLYTVYASIDSSNVRVFRPIEVKMIGLSEFEIISIPDIDLKDLKVLDIDDFEKLNVEKLITVINYKIGDIVKCDLLNFYDYPNLVIL